MAIELSEIASDLAKLVAPYADAQESVISKTLVAPPPSPAVGDRYIVPVSALDEWAGKACFITTWSGTEWTFVDAETGMSAWIVDEAYEAFFNGTLWISNTGRDSSGGRVSKRNRRMPARETVFDGDRGCDIAMVATPLADSAVVLTVNGLSVDDLGDGTKVGAAYYFSGDGGVTARAISEIQIGDVMYWQGSIALYQLASTDVLSFIYEIA